MYVINRITHSTQDPYTPKMYNAGSLRSRMEYSTVSEEDALSYAKTVFSDQVAAYEKWLNTNECFGYTVIVQVINIITGEILLQRSSNNYSEPRKKVIINEQKVAEESAKKARHANFYTTKVQANSQSNPGVAAGQWAWAPSTEFFFDPNANQSNNSF